MWFDFSRFASMKPVCLNLEDRDRSEDLLNATSTIKKLYDLYGQKIMVLSKMPELFKDNPHVEKSYKASSVNMEFINNTYTLCKISSDAGKNPSMKKLLIITPHLSTGGAPQVTVNKVELLKDHFDIKVVEYSFISWEYVVQRNRIIELVGQDNFISLGDNKLEELRRAMISFTPDVVSMEEFPEFFMDSEVAKMLYNPAREYTIIETTHDSSFNKKDKTCFPDRFVFVSAYNLFQYIDFDIPAEVIEYPINPKVRNQKEMREKLGLEHHYKHIVIVGLFTPRKNQAYAFEMARKMQGSKVKFHFLGNQAGNFQDYWKPLMDNKPDNCVIWGERDDVTSFIEACDVFLFPSKGERNNKELNPIAIKEAMEYDIHKMMYNLDVYCNKYNNMDHVTLLTGDVDRDVDNLFNILNVSKVNPDEELIVVGAWPNLKERISLTEKCLNSLKPLGRKIMVVSHYPVGPDLQRMADYYIYDGHNPLTHHSYYSRFYNYMPTYDVEININGLKNSNQSLTVLTNLFNAFKAAKQLGYKRIFYTTYDVVIDPRDLSIIESTFEEVTSTSTAYLASIDTPLGKLIETTAMTIDVDFFLSHFTDHRDEDSYNNHCQQLSCQNFLEHYFMSVIKDVQGVKIIENKEETFLVNSGRGVSSNSEYYSIIPVRDRENRYMFYFFTYNIDQRVVYVKIGEYLFKIDIAKNREFKHEFEFTGNPIEVVLSFYDGDNMYKEETYVLSNETIDKYKHTGYFKWKAKPRIKLVHIQTTLNDEREQASRSSLEVVRNYGWEYVLHTNEPYKSLPPVHTSLRPHCVSMELFDEQKTREVGTALTPAHYGCYEAFKNAILSEFHNCDFLIVCEGDCIIDTDVNRFISTVEASCPVIEDNNIGYMSFGDVDTLEHGWKQSNPIRDLNDFMFITNHIIGLQCIMFPKKAADYLKHQLRTHPWDASDIYFNIIMGKSGFEMGIVKERLTTQADGHSLIDNTYKTFRKK